MNGVDLIAAERARRADLDADVVDQSFVWAAVCLAAPRHVLAGPPAARFSPTFLPALADPWPWPKADGRVLPRPINPNDLMSQMDDGHALSLALDDERQGNGVEQEVRELRVRELVKAGAFIAAEIDRLQRADNGTEDTDGDR